MRAVVEQANGLRGQVDERIATIERELGELTAEQTRLEALRADLTAFIEQPDRGAEGRSGPGPASTSAAASSPPGGSPPATHVACPVCAMRVKAQGLGSHMRRHRAGAGSEPPKGGTPAKVANGKAGHPSRESFLCARSCGRSFPTREACREHEAAATCQLVPTRPPVGPRPLVLGSGLGE